MPLTPREHDVLSCLRLGLPDKVIARRLRISHRTVKAHCHNIYEKLKVHNRTQAAVLNLGVRP